MRALFRQGLTWACAISFVSIFLTFGAWFPLPRPRYARLKVLANVAYGCFLFVLFWLFHSPVPIRITRNEDAAMKYLEDSAIAAELDAWKHGGLYAESVGGLGLNSNPECTVAARMMNSVSTTGYLPQYWLLSSGGPQRKGIQSQRTSSRAEAPIQLAGKKKKFQRLEV